jgi:Tripartite tricarboxylate transporter family receptor
MKLPRRRFLHLAAGATALPAVSRIARAQAYPTRPVRVIVAFTPGSAPDFVARLMSQWLSERIGQQFLVENRPGAGGNIGAEVVVRAPADGYTLLLLGAPNAINTTLYDKLSFNFLREYCTGREHQSRTHRDGGASIHHLRTEVQSSRGPCAISIVRRPRRPR